MESSDKAVAIVFATSCLLGVIGLTVTTLKDAYITAEAIRSGLQHCIVEVNHIDQVVWKKECEK